MDGYDGILVDSFFHPLLEVSEASAPLDFCCDILWPGFYFRLCCFDSVPDDECVHCPHKGTQYLLHEDRHGDPEDIYPCVSLFHRIPEASDLPPHFLPSPDCAGHKIRSFLILYPARGIREQMRLQDNSSLSGDFPENRKVFQQIPFSRL